MTLIARRRLVAALVALPSFARAQTHQHHSGQFERLNQPGRIDLPDTHAQQAVTDSPAPRAAQPGRWTPARAAADPAHRDGVGRGLPQPRAPGRRLCRAARRQPYHHAYDPAADRWDELRAAAARRQPCRRRDARRAALRLRRLHRAEPHAARRGLRLRRREVDAHPPPARGVRRDGLHRARRAASTSSAGRSAATGAARSTGTSSTTRRPTATSAASRCRWRATTPASSSWATPST